MALKIECSPTNAAVYHAMLHFLMWGVVLAAVGSCALTTHAAKGYYFVQPSPGRCSCLLILPFSNLSNVKSAGETVTDLFSAQLSADPRFHSFGRDKIVALLNRLGITEPTEWRPKFGLEIARLVGADGIVFGTVGGSWATPPADSDLLWIEGIMLSAASGEVLWAAAELLPGPDVSRSHDMVLRQAAAAMASRLVRDLRPRRTVALGACLKPEVRAAVVPLETQTVSSTAAVGAVTQDSDLPTDVRVTDAVRKATPSEPQDTAPVQAPDPDKAQSDLPPASDRAEPPLAEEAQQMLERLGSGQPLPLETVRFVNRSTRLPALTGPQLEVLGALMQAKPDLELQFRVHTDASGDSEKDLRITTRQAAALAKRLAKLWRVDAKRLHAVGVGDSHPVQPNITKRGRESNRRVDVLAFLP